MIKYLHQYLQWILFIYPAYSESDLHMGEELDMSLLFIHFRGHGKLEAADCKGASQLFDL